VVQPGGAAGSTPSDPLIGQLVGGRYRVLRRLGRGGMGQVYEVEHIHLRRTFALKRLIGNLARDGEQVARFRREAELVGRLRHPNVVQVSDWESLPDGSPCLVMELLEGDTLATCIERDGPLGWARIARIADQVLSALAAAHRHGIIHRDLKPGNIVLARDDSGREQAKLLDFGVSRSVHSPHTSSGQKLIGTPEYMSPEQADSRPVGPSTDVWAFGVVLFEMASGQVPFTGDSVPAILYQICHGEPPPLSALRSDAPDELVRVVRRVLSRDPARRIERARLLRRLVADALGAIARDEEESLVMTGPGERPHSLISDALTVPRFTLAAVGQGALTPVTPEPARMTVPTVDERPRARAAGTPGSEPAPVIVSRAPARRGRLVAALLGLAVVGGAAAASIHLAGGSEQVQAAPDPRPPAPVVEAAPTVAEEAPAPAVAPDPPPPAVVETTPARHPHRRSARRPGKTASTAATPRDEPLPLE